VGLLTGLITLPLAPVRGTIWIAEQLLEEAERQLNDPTTIEQQLVDAEASFERGEMSQDDFERLEDELLRRLMARGGS
jgi:NAD-specific glutamate dehydrogenase